MEQKSGNHGERPGLGPGQNQGEAVKELSAGGKRASNPQAVLAETWWAKRHRCLNGYTGGAGKPFLLNLSFPTPQQSFGKKTLCCEWPVLIQPLSFSAALERKGCFEDIIPK